MLIEIDENNYCTGNFDIATIDTMKNYVYTEELPEWYEDELKFKATKCIKVPKETAAEGDVPYSISYELDETKYAELLEQLNNSAYEAETECKIEELKRALSETDYQIIKCYEYSLVGKTCNEYDIEELHNNRQIIRDKINKLEEMLNKQS